MKTIRLILFFLLFSAAGTFADESITITTYYPSPYGAYNELSANKLIIGAGLSSPTADGVLRFRPADLSGRCYEGELYYDYSEHILKFCDNTSTWKSLAVGGTVGGVSELLPGTLCGMSDVDGTTTDVKCQGFYVYAGCPPGYKSRLVAQARGNSIYSCVKD